MPETAVAQGPTLDVCVIAHDNIELTISCLKTLCKNTRSPFHLIVVDDSTDLTPLYMNQFCKEHDNVTYIHSTVPYKTGNQIFLKALDNCRTKYMATVMNSTRVEPDWEMVAVQVLDGDPKIGVVGLKCLQKDGTIESAYIAMDRWTPCDAGKGMPGHRLCFTHEVQAVQWAFAVVRVEAAKAVLEPFVFHGFVGWDDIDNCFCMKKAGWKIFACGAGAAYHDTRATRGSNSEEVARKNTENGQLFYKRWGFWDEFIKEVPSGDVHVRPAPKAAK
jgi:GT2 family glycosyltransferase